MKCRECSHYNICDYSTIIDKEINCRDFTPQIATSQWVMVMDDFDDDKGEREYPHCSHCGRGVYKHDAGKYCPFCGAAMKNPMRY